MSSPSRYSSYKKAKNLIFCKGETIKSLCHHIVDKYRKLIEDVDYVDIFKSMILHYDQAQEALDHTRDSER